MITIKIPGNVWYDYLDPQATGMQAELGLPRAKSRQVGKGWQAVYRDVDEAVVRELAKYLEDRAGTLLSQGWPPYEADEQRERNTHRRAIRLAEQLRRQAGPDRGDTR
jgi:hypothetical protein